MKINIFNACTDLGVDVYGASSGPKELKKELVNKQEINKIIDLECDCSNKSSDPLDLEKNYDKIMEFSNNMYYEITSNNDNDTFNFVIGGDHSVAVPSALASCKLNGDIGIIWCDAHIDYNTFETTITGNIHGLPLASINGLNKKLSVFHDGEYISPKNTVVVGYRAQEENKMAELNNIKQMGVTVFTTEDIRKYGISNIMKKAFTIASENNTKKVHISYDLDLIDPNVAPGVSIPEVDGINEYEAYEVLNGLLKTKNHISSFDLVEFNPLNDVDDKTKKIALNIINTVIDNFYKKK